MNAKLPNAETQPIRTTESNKMSNRPICFYHRADLDGICSGAVVNHFVPDCELYGYDYADQFPWDLVTKSPRTVYMVDVSLPYADMKRLKEVSKEVLYIDHHKTAIEELADLNLGGSHHTGCWTKAACELAWEFFDTGGRCPVAVTLLGRYDVWDHSGKTADWDKDIHPFQYGCRSVDGIYSPSLKLWEKLLSLEPLDEELAKKYKDPVAPLVTIGSAILKFQKQQCQSIAANGAFEAILSAKTDADRPLLAICLNTPINNSMSFESVFNTAVHDLCVPYTVLKDGVVRVSLYSDRKDVDCGRVAKNIAGDKGGGHRGAAGFRCTLAEFDKLFPKTGGAK